MLLIGFGAVKCLPGEANIDCLIIPLTRHFGERQRIRPDRTAQARRLIRQLFQPDAPVNSFPDRLVNWKGNQ